MISTSITTKAFYQNLGKLFYAIAFTDKNVRQEEFSKLKVCILEFWLDYDHLLDVFGNDAAYQIEMVFEGLEAFEEPALKMYDDFIDYKKEHPELFTAKANTLILDTATAIAHSFSRINKSELVMLAQLKLELKSS